MKSKDFLQLYREDSLVQTIERLFAYNIQNPAHLQCKGIVGSLDAVLAVALYLRNPQTHLFILHEKEEAAYFLNDLQNLLPDKEILFFPTSYRKPYQFIETDNANILRRAEVLSQLSLGGNELIVTYPEALTEKVISQKSLVQNTFVARVGEKLDTNFIAEFLLSYDFDKTDFVYEAGQFSIRGGIVDVFSFANDLPYRIELFGDEIESIRTFNPDTQLSVATVSQVSIVPNIQSKVTVESRETFLSFLPKDVGIWAKDIELTLEVIEKYFEKATEAYEAAKEPRLISKPEELFDTRRNFLNQLKEKRVIEFGKKAYFKNAEKIEYSASAQPSFNKDFNLLATNLQDNLTHGYINTIAADSIRQHERLNTIFQEINPYINYQSLNLAFREGFVDHNTKIACYTDHQIFDRFHRYKAKERFSKSKAMTLRELRTLQPGDYVTHIDYGIGRFAGLEKIEVNGSQQEAIRLVFRDDDLLYVSIYSLHKIAKYTGKDGNPPQMSKLGSPEWENKKSRIKKQVKDIAKELISLYAKRKAAPGFAYSRDSFLQAELESSFLYEDTPDQAKATADVKKDMEQAHPMDRLVCGDVGFGKTEVAIRAAFKAATDGKQVAVLVPTTVLAMQHYKTFKERLEKFPVRVEYVNRFKTTQQIKETLQKVADGSIDILIGTHRLVGSDVKFKNLGLLIIDEEQKFGVKTKDKLKEMRVNVDVLTLTATPIPRTLHFSLMGARDLSIIATPPPNRQPVTTEVQTFSEEMIRDAISEELRRGGQVFFVHNRINDIVELGDTILRLVPDAKIGVAHGQMEGSKLEKTMLKFIDGEYDVLLSTNIIESGLDIPNANTIIINRAHQFGLADLHQMRGRVGRSNRKAYCYLLTPPPTSLSSDSRKRLHTLEEFSDLGDGFKISMRDLDIRGAGNLLGAEQSGFISDLGFETYHKILDDAIQELKEDEFKELFADELNVKELITDCVIESDLSIIIPETYVPSISERLNLYSQLDNIKEEVELEKFTTEIIDRFGQMPEEVKDLIEMVRLRWIAERLGFEKLTLKNGSMKGYFVPADNEKYFKSDVFGNILLYIQQNPKKCRLKEAKDKLILIFDEIKSISQARDILSLIDEKVKMAV
ncbi:transcription-repair coupling factor [Xanthocytophaga flava]|uniref:transcription-repair coupling factor n=1 Tax=Xanthocytophaga flava TaxID=3048013 RepID=UPI0028D7CFEE|nr:transcription-repair coupling factor [Xanthocytophaga flavus]MDJ1473102.1 transcription-repair coupling factor [Xanthocytophaga flavus]